MTDTNNKGEYALYSKGKFLGWGEVAMVDGHRVLASLKSMVANMQVAASKDNILLTLNSGFRTFNEQLKLRVQNTSPTNKAKGLDREDKFLLTAPSTEFTPLTAMPGWSNHQDGHAFDFQTRDLANTKGNENAYAWLVKHAIEHGFIRTVSSERWHWEYRPGQDQFSVVPKTHSSWDNLV